MAQIYCSKIIPAQASDVFEYMTNLDHLEDMLADNIDVEVLERPKLMQFESEFELKMTRYGLSQKVRGRVVDFIKDKRITYSQRSGLFQSWTHAQVLEETPEGHTKLIDVVDYDLPFSFVGHILSDVFVKKDMTRVLEERLDFIVDHFSAGHSRAQAGSVHTQEATASL